MAVSITTRPRGNTFNFSAGKLPCAYKFTSTGHGALLNYRIEVEVFKSSDNTSLTGGIKFTISPNSAGLSYFDLAAVVVNYLKPEWSNIVAELEKDTDTDLKVYIKYQELYDGSATSVVNDSANPIHIVLGALQIPSTTGVAMESYCASNANINPAKWLTMFNKDELKVWRGYPFTLNWIRPAGEFLTTLRRRVTQLDIAGNAVTNNVDMLSDTPIDSVVRMRLPALNANAKTLKVWLTDTAGTVSFDTITNSGGNIKLTLTNPGDYVKFSQNQSITIDEGGFFPVYTGFAATVASIDPSGFIICHENYIAPNEGYGTITGEFQIMETLTIAVEEPCANPVYLFWKNSLGGDSFWMFDFNQEAENKINKGKKVKRKTLFAVNCTTSQLNALDELNTPGDEFGVNIVEFTSSTIKTSYKEDQQVYIVDSSGNKVGVIVLPVTNKYPTRESLHTLELDIEYPEVFI